MVVTNMSEPIRGGIPDFKRYFGQSPESFINKRNKKVSSQYPQTHTHAQVIMNKVK